jgi:hypothetical protein
MNLIGSFCCLASIYCSDPPWFNDAWLSKIKENVASNKILKVNCIKGFLCCIGNLKEGPISFLYVIGSFEN